MNAAKKTASGFAAALSFAVVRAMAAHHPATANADAHAEVHAQLVEYVRTMKLPNKISEEVSIINVRLDGDVITYTYDTKAGDEAGVVVDHDAAQAELTKNICGDPEIRRGIDAGITMHSIYQTNGVTIGELTVSSCSMQPAAAQPTQSLAYSYDIIGDRIIIHAKGAISDDEVTAFNAWWKTLPPHAAERMRVGTITLALDSPGGMIDGARHMTDWVKENKVDTVVPNGATCASSCVMIWGAGEHKFAGENAQIGVHGASSMLASNDAKVADAQGTLFVARTLADEKAPATVIAAVATTPPSDVHWLIPADLVAWGTTMIDKDGKTTPWSANAY
jgi:ATP-dependent protease ClpP protease subunit